MIKRIQIANKFLAVIILSAITLLFMHSELGFFSCHNEDNHIEHDYCRIVQNTTPGTDFDHQSNHVFEQVNDIFQANYFIDNNIIIPSIISLNYEKPIVFKIPIKAYIKNSILLI